VKDALRLPAGWSAHIVRLPRPEFVDAIFTTRVGEQLNMVNEPEPA